MTVEDELDARLRRLRRELKLVHDQDIRNDTTRLPKKPPWWMRYWNPARHQRMEEGRAWYRRIVSQALAEPETPEDVAMLAQNRTLREISADLREIPGITASFTAAPLPDVATLEIRPLRYVPYIREQDQDFLCLGKLPLSQIDLPDTASRGAPTESETEIRCHSDEKSRTEIASSHKDLNMVLSKSAWHGLKDRARGASAMFFLFETGEVARLPWLHVVNRDGGDGETFAFEEHRV